VSTGGFYVKGRRERAEGTKRKRQKAKREKESAKRGFTLLPSFSSFSSFCPLPSTF
jgi:hypothetical protein